MFSYNTDPVYHRRIALHLLSKRYMEVLQPWLTGEEKVDEWEEITITPLGMCITRNYKKLCQIGDEEGKAWRKHVEETSPLLYNAITPTFHWASTHLLNIIGQLHQVARILTLRNVAAVKTLDDFRKFSPRHLIDIEILDELMLTIVAAMDSIAPGMTLIANSVRRDGFLELNPQTVYFCYAAAGLFATIEDWGRETRHILREYGVEEGHRDILNSPNFSLPFLDDNLLKGAILWASGANILLEQWLIARSTVVEILFRQIIALMLKCKSESDTKSFFSPRSIKQFIDIFNCQRYVDKIWRQLRARMESNAAATTSEHVASIHRQFTNAHRLARMTGEVRRSLEELGSLVPNVEECLTRNLVLDKEVLLTQPGINNPVPNEPDPLPGPSSSSTLVQPQESHDHEGGDEPAVFANTDQDLDQSRDNNDEDTTRDEFFLARGNLGDEGNESVHEDNDPTTQFAQVSLNNVIVELKTKLTEVKVSMDMREKQALKKSTGGGEDVDDSSSSDESESQESRHFEKKVNPAPIFHTLDNGDQPNPDLPGPSHFNMTSALNSELRLALSNLKPLNSSEFESGPDLEFYGSDDDEEEEEA
ncbi:uncharacterized protein LOC110857711 isoform X2 [Folsomia candida]|uniref:uncharacterized protein LOC110857711 isoform X2 n=1 Tax=Folsomia candida TaxID=158441 RepID=UPI000B8F2A8E|nr:uncharacterized protein LOC110857711 isoform X2 [Folsomia candida]